MIEATFGVVYAVYPTVDDRGGLGKCDGYYAFEDTAMEKAKKIGWWGGDGKVIPKRVIKVGSQTFVLEERDPIRVDATVIDRQAVLREQGIAKLTREEREALGLAVHFKENVT